MIRNMESDRKILGFKKSKIGNYYEIKYQGLSLFSIVTFEELLKALELDREKEKRVQG